MIDSLSIFRFIVILQTRDFLFFFHVVEGMESKLIEKVPQVTSQSSEKSSSSIETSISKMTLDPNNPRPVLKHQPKATFTSTGECLLVDNKSSETQKQCSAPSESTPGNSFRMSIDEDHPAKGKRRPVSMCTINKLI